MGKKPLFYLAMVSGILAITSVVLVLALAIFQGVVGFIPTLSAIVKGLLVGAMILVVVFTVSVNVWLGKISGR